MLKQILLAVALTAASMSCVAQTKLGDILGSIGQTIKNATATTKFSTDDLVGSWKYKSPAVSFKSESTLKNIGGAAAATAVENKLATYYKRYGLTNVSLEVDSTGTAASPKFVMKLSRATVRGNILKKEDGSLAFKFNVFGKINLGEVDCMATKSGSELNLTFDAKRFITLISKVAAITGSSSIKALTELLNSYENIYIGFRLEKTSKDTPATKQNTTPKQSTPVKK